MILTLLKFLKDYYKPLLIMALLTGVYGYGHHKGVKEVQAAWDKQKAADKIATQDYIIKTERKQTEISNEVSNDYETQIDSITADYNNALNSVRAAGQNNQLPAIPQPAGRSGKAAGKCAISERDKENLLNLAREADDYRVRLIALQDWVKKQAGNR